MKLALLCFAVSAPAGLLAQPSPSPTPIAPARTAILISDTHFGVGRDGESWHPFEDSRWADEFRLFLESLTRGQQGPLDLVLLGDTFELWQSRDPDCRYENKNLSCVEGEAVERLRWVLTQHASEVSALRRFAESGQNKIIVVPGNHDAALMFPAAAKLLVDAFRPLRFSVAEKGYWLSDNGRLYAEHGHQIGKDPGRYDGWPIPFLERDQKKHLQKVWGERFVREFYDPYERKYPIVDNIGDELGAARLAFSAEGTGSALKGLKDFFRLMVFGASWAQFKKILGPGDTAPKWDYAMIRSKGDSFFLELLDPADPLRETLAAEARTPEGLGISLHELTDDDLKTLCDTQQIRRAEAQRAGEANVPPACPTATLGPEGGLGAVTEKLMRRRNEIFSDHLDGVSKQLEMHGRNPRFELFVFGHTHAADYGFLPKEGRGGWNPKVVNTGAWQRVISLAQAKAWRKKNNWTNKQLLERGPEELPPCYSFVRVVEGKESTASLMFWRRASNGTWGESTDCD